MEHSRKAQARLEKCFHTCAKPAWRLAYSLLRDSHEAYDVVSSAFLVAARKADQIPTSGMWPWFSVVVAHEARNARRKKSKVSSLEEAFGNESQSEGTRSIEMEDPAAPDPADAMMSEESQRLLWQALDTLPPNERDAIMLTRIGGMTHAAAAEVLAMPRKTLTSHVKRGMEHLQGKLEVNSRGLSRLMIALPIALPPGGWESALTAWKTSAGIGLASSSSGVMVGTGVGGALMAAKSTILATGLAFGMGIGAGAGYLMSEDAKAQGGAQEERAQANTVMGSDDDSLDQTKRQLSKLQSDYDDLMNRFTQSETERAQAAKRTPEVAPESKAPGGDGSASKINALTNQRDNLVQKVDELERLLEPFRDELDRRAPSFTFADGEVLEAVRNANWPQMARATKATNQAMFNIVSAVRRGESPDPKDQLALQENVEKRRKYEFRVLGKIPTFARFNGENTAPITFSNVIAAMLEDAGIPLNESQITSIQQLGERFNESAERRTEAYPENTLRTQKLMDEYVAKGAFEDAVVALLSSEQRDVVVNPDTHRIAGLDLNGPTLMLINTSPVIVGESIEEIKPKLINVVTQSFQLNEEETARLAPLVDSWALDVQGILDPIPRVGYARSYTFDQSVIAGQATIKLLTEMLRLLQPNEDSQALIRNYADFFIPRVLEPEEQ